MFLKRNKTNNVLHEFNENGKWILNLGRYQKTVTLELQRGNQIPCNLVGKTSAATLYLKKPLELIHSKGTRILIQKFH